MCKYRKVTGLHSHCVSFLPICFCLAIATDSVLFRTDDYLCTVVTTSARIDVVIINELSAVAKCNTGSCINSFWEVDQEFQKFHRRPLKFQRLFELGSAPVRIKSPGKFLHFLDFILSGSSWQFHSAVQKSHCPYTWLHCILIEQSQGSVACQRCRRWIGKV